MLLEAIRKIVPKHRPPAKIDRDKQTDGHRQTDRQTDRNTKTDTEWQTDKWFCGLRRDSGELRRSGDGR